LQTKQKIRTCTL